MSNPDVTWGISYNDWDHNNYTLSAEEAKIDDAVTLTKQAWDYYSVYVGTGSSESQYFKNALRYEEEAIECFKGNDIDGYIENMDSACEEYQKI